MILSCMLGAKFGGLERVFLDQLQMLPQAGLTVRGLVRRGSPTAKRAKEHGLPCDEIGVLSDWDPLTRARARAVIGRHRPQLILCHGRKAHRIVVRAIGTTIPIIAMVHKPQVDTDLPAAAYVVVAEHRRRSLIADDVRPERIVVIPNAVAVPQAPKRSYAVSTPHIVALGRLHRKKGFDVLIGALARLAQDGVAFTCSIAGEGPERGDLEKRIGAARLSQHVRLVGWTDEVAAFLSGGDIFVLPSRQEDLPLALLEAMAGGLPIVASCIDGPKDILRDNKTALLVSPDDDGALADAIRTLMADAALRERVGRSGRAEAERAYAMPVIGAKLAAALEHILRENAA